MHFELQPEISKDPTGSNMDMHVLLGRSSVLYYTMFGV